MNDVPRCRICGLKVHRVWPQTQTLEVVRQRQTDAEGLVWRHHLEPQRDGHDPAVVREPAA